MVPFVFPDIISYLIEIFLYHLAFPDLDIGGHEIICLYMMLILTIGLFLYNIVISETDITILNEMELSSPMTSSSSSNSCGISNQNHCSSISYINIPEENICPDQCNNRRYSCIIEPVQVWKQCKDKTKLVEDSFKYPIHRSTSFMNNLCDCNEDFVEFSFFSPSRRIKDTNFLLFYNCQRQYEPFTDKKYDVCNAIDNLDLSDLIRDNSTEVTNEASEQKVLAIETKNSYQSPAPIDGDILHSSLAIQPSSESPPELSVHEKTLEI
jgi:hypothetical protein